jgi:hypothetical protein
MFKVEFPQGKIYLDKEKNAYLEYNDNFINKFNKNGNEVQMFLDKTVAQALMSYVSLRTGVQEKSIKLATVVGSGKVIIGVPYAEYQAYSKKISKRVGKRGTQPFERMKSDKKESILRQVSAYSKRLNNG